MITENNTLLQKAKDSLTGKWTTATIASLIFLLITATVSPRPASSSSNFVSILSLIVMGPMTLGMTIFGLNISRDQEANPKQIFQGFNHFITAVSAYFLVVLFIILWMLLFIIPGIIAALSYSMTFFILADNPAINPLEAIDQSKKMMDGYKMKLFYLSLRFLGLAILCILTLGIGFIWLNPYIYVTMAKFYDDIKGNTTSNMITTTNAL